MVLPLFFFSITTHFHELRASWVDYYLTFGQWWGTRSKPTGQDGSLVDKFVITDFWIFVTNLWDDVKRDLPLGQFVTWNRHSFIFQRRCFFWLNLMLSMIRREGLDVPGEALRVPDLRSGRCPYWDSELWGSLLLEDLSLSQQIYHASPNHQDRIEDGRRNQEC
jgi:hypothetical protein